MTKEATGSALELIDEKQLDIEAIEGTGDNGKVTKPDVQKYMESLAGADESTETDESEEGSADGDDSETEEGPDEAGETEGSASDESESDDEDESDESESADDESESDDESGDSELTGPLICVFPIKGDNKKYKPGDEYTGDNAEHLLRRGAIKKT